MHEEIQKFCSFKVGQSSARKKEKRRNAAKLGKAKQIKHLKVPRARWYSSPSTI